MPEATINIIKGDKTSIDTDYRDALAVNMYPVVHDILGARGYMLCYPGLTKVGTGSGIDRAGNYNERFETHFRVSGGSLIKLNPSGSVTSLGAVSGAEQASMPYSFNTQAVIADGKMFLYSPVDGFSQVTDTDIGHPIDGVWVDGYYVVIDSEYIYHSELTDESSFEAIDFASAEFMPDPNKGIAKTQDNKVLIFGRYSVEYFRNVAKDNFAFTRLQDRAQKIGIVATHAKCEVGSRFYFTGGRKDESLGVYILGVGSSVKVSSREVDKLLAEYTEPELADMRMETRMEGDITFVLVHLPNETLCFNETVAKTFGKDSSWSILKSDIDGDTPYRGINGVFDANRGDWIYGDKQNTNIGLLDNTVCTQYGEKVEWLLFSPLLRLEKMSISKLEIETIPGHTVSDDATVSVSKTSDGLTYGKEWFLSYGKPQEYGQRFYVNRPFGYIRVNFGFKLRGSSTSRMSFASTRITYG